MGLSFAGFLFIGLAFFMFYRDKKLSEQCTTEVVATISRIETYRRKKDTKHDVFVEYYHNGTYYEEELHYYLSGMYEGQEINLYIDPSDPHKIHYKSGNKFACIFLACLGLPFIITDIVIFARIIYLFFS